jgi:hypothetical protein
MSTGPAVSFASELSAGTLDDVEHAVNAKQNATRLRIRTGRSARLFTYVW